MESDLRALLVALCQRVYPDFAPLDAPRPYVTFQGIAGDALRYVDNTAADKRSTLVQIDAWADTRAASLVLIRQIEDAMCAASVFTASVDGEPRSLSEPESKLYGCQQDFTILSAR